MPREKRRKREAWRSLQNTRSLKRYGQGTQPGDVVILDGEREPQVMHLVEFSVTSEPMADPQLGLMSPADRAEYDAHERVLAAVVHGEPVSRAEIAAYIALLTRLYAAYPRIAKLNNHLVSALQTTGDFKKVPALIREGYRNCPDNLFAVVGYVQLLMSEGRLDEAGEVLAGRMSIAAIAPGRRLFHVSEVAAYQGTVGLYLALIGQTKPARICLEMVESVYPEHPIVERLRKALAPSYAFNRNMIGVLRELRKRVGKQKNSP